jgi:NTE family protein
LHSSRLFPALSHRHSRPRIGLALSGGGARGLAHIGVLKVLEEMRIPVSCVTGTSMGAVVGGTYAAGRRLAQMEGALACLMQYCILVNASVRWY